MSPAPVGVKVVGSGAPQPTEEEVEVVDTAPAPAEPGRSRLWRVLTVVFAVVALAGVFGTVFFWSRVRTYEHRDDAQKAVLATSRDFLLALTNFQANTIDTDFNRIQSYATGQFQTQALQFFSSDVRKSLAKVQAVSRGQISSLYVQSVGGDQAVTYADVHQTIANINFKSPEQDELRIVLNLSKLPDGWRIAYVTVLQAPAMPTATP